MHRGWQDHPIFGDEVFSKRDAWVWLIEAAIFSNDGYLACINGMQVFLMRGSLTYSLDFLADAWGWHRSKVDRFLKKIEKAGMIEIESETGQNIVTICNYSEYQLAYEAIETKIGTRPIQEQDKADTNNKKAKKERKKIDTSGSALRADAHALPCEKWKLALQMIMKNPVYKSWGAHLRLEEGYVTADSSFILDRCKDHYEHDVRQALEETGHEFLGFRSPRNVELAKSG